MNKWFVISLILWGNLSACAQKTFEWPDGAKAAVCLTYDDAMPEHLDVIGPTLDSLGLKATFYINAGAITVESRRAEWIEMANNGHELGNHTLYHPCLSKKYGRESFDWVKPEQDLLGYTLNQIIEEIRMTNLVLQGLDGKTRRSYAYTCSDHFVGDSLFFHDKISHLVTSARREGPIPENMSDIDLYLMPSIVVSHPTGKELIAYVKEAAKKGTIVTFMFHGLGDSGLSVTEEAHMELLQYLKSNSDTYYVDTFLNVTDYIKSQQ